MQLFLVWFSFDDLHYVSICTMFVPFQLFYTRRYHCELEVLTAKPPLPWRPRPLSNTTLLIGTTRVFLLNGISFRPTALAGCTSVTDDIHTDGQTDGPRYGNTCCNRRCYLIIIGVIVIRKHPERPNLRPRFSCCSWLSVGIAIVNEES